MQAPLERDVGMTAGQSVERMRAAPGDVRLAEAGASALVARTGGRDDDPSGVDVEARCAECVAGGAVEALMDALVRHALSAEVAEQSCWALRNLAASSAGKAACAAAGTLPVLLAAFHAHCDARGITKWGLGALVHSAAPPAPGAEPCVFSTSSQLEAGAVPALAACLTADAVEVVWGACSALLCIAISSVNGHQACVAAIPALVACLQHTLAGVVQEACSALGCIAEFGSSNSGRDACVAAGAIPALVSVLHIHAGAERVVGEAADVLRYIARSDPGACVPATPALVSALKAHIGAAWVVERACGALEEIAIFHGAGAFSTAHVPIFLAVLEAHAGSAKITQLVSRVLGSCSTKAAAAPALIAALHSHAGDAKSACLALLSLQSAPGQKVAVAESEVPALIAAWRRATRPHLG